MGLCVNRRARVAQSAWRASREYFVTVALCARGPVVADAFVVKTSRKGIHLYVDR